MASKESIGATLLVHSSFSEALRSSYDMLALVSQCRLLAVCLWDCLRVYSQRRIILPLHERSNQLYNPIQYSFCHLPAAGLRVTCDGRGRETCGRINDATWGNDSCPGRVGDLAGSFWFSCRWCSFPGGGSGDGGGDGRNGDDDDDDTPARQAATGFAQELLDQKKHLSSVMPDVVRIEGQLFPVNYDMPREVTEEINRVFDNPALGYKDLPKEVRGYELVNLDDSM